VTVSGRMTASQTTSSYSHMPPVLPQPPAMKVLTLVPARQVNQVFYGCDGCGDENVKAVPRAG
jgi:hypothetical protein